MNYILILLISLTFLACNTQDSDEIKDQTEIYAHYNVKINKGSSKAVGEVVFYEKSNKYFKDYVALRGSSYVSYQGNRMQEIIDFGNTSYKNNHLSTRTIQTSDVFEFEYVNNDGKIFVNRLSAPSFLAIDYSTIKVSYTDTTTEIAFDWDFLDQNKCFNQPGKCSGVNFRVYAEINGTQSFRTVDIRKKPAQIIFDNSIDYIKEITLCTSLTQQAVGAGTSNKKTTTYCDEQYSL